MKPLFILITLLFSANAFSQSNYTVCKFDTAHSRVIILAKREYITDMKNTIQVVKEIESKFANYKNLSLSFFDASQDCTELNKAGEDKLKAHCFADFSAKTRLFEYYKPDGSFEVLWSMVVDKDTKL